MADLPQPLIEPEDIADRNIVNDLRRSKPVHLLLENVPKPRLPIREQLLHLRTPVEALHDLRRIHPGLHVEVDERVVRVVEAAGILLLQMVDHLLDHGLRSEDLERLLRRDIVENVLDRPLVKIIRQPALEVQELPDRVVENDLVEEARLVLLPLAGRGVVKNAAVPQLSELLHRDAGDFEEYIFRNLYIF